MRAIQVRCPNCGANLDVQDDATSVECKYCNTSSRIQTRSRILQVPRPLPSLDDVAPRTIARQRVGCAVPLVIAGVVAAATIVPIVFALQKVKVPKIPRVATPAATSGPRPVPAAEQWQWDGGAPVLADVDGDGVDDLIGFTRYVQDGDRMHLAAFSGATGKRLWEGPRLGTYTEVYQGELSRIGDAILRSEASGGLAAYALADGAQRWETPLGEKVKVLCPDADGAIAVETADQRWHRIDPATGARTDGKPLAVLDGSKPKLDPLVRVIGEVPPGTCVPPDTNARDAQPGLRVADSWSRLPAVEGIDPRRAARRGDGPIVVSGSKRPGTSVPMIAVLDGKKLRWKDAIAAIDPLNSRGEDALYTMDATAVYVIYEPPSKPPRLTAFALADGKRLWDQEVRQGTTIVMTSLFVAGPRVMLSAWGHVQSFDAATGAPSFLIGEL